MKHVHAAQELLPPIDSEPTRPAGWFDWLTDPNPQRFLLPGTGLLILGLDWLLFPKEAASMGMATPLTAVIGFLAASFGAYHLQRHRALDSRPAALFKAVVAGLLVGVPFPLAGTIAGGWVLASSGLAELKSRFFRGVLNRK